MCAFHQILKALSHHLNMLSEYACWSIQFRPRVEILATHRVTEALLSAGYNLGART